MQGVLVQRRAHGAQGAVLGIGIEGRRVVHVQGGGAAVGAILEEVRGRGLDAHEEDVVIDVVGERGRSGERQGHGGEGEGLQSHPNVLWRCGRPRPL